MIKNKRLRRVMKQIRKSMHSMKEKILSWFSLDEIIAFISLRQLSKEINLFNKYLDEGCEETHSENSLDDYYEKAKRTHSDISQTLESIESSKGLTSILIKREYTKLAKLNNELKEKMCIFEMMAGKESSAMSIYRMEKSDFGDPYFGQTPPEKKVN